MTSGPPSGSPSSAPPSFEDAMKRLAQIVERLESGELTLEQSLVLFEEGVTLSRMAQSKLEDAQRKVEQLIAVDGQGRTKTTPFDT